MKALLALSLLLFLDSVFSLADIFTCPTFGQCPEGYTEIYSGRNMLNGVCQCKKDTQKAAACSFSVISCKLDKPRTDFNQISSDRSCSDVESNCSTKEIMNACDNSSFPVPGICDRANQKLRKEKKAEAQGQCEFSKNQCNIRLSDHCMTAATCDPDTTIQLCKNNSMPINDYCEAAEIQKEKERAEDTKYSCNYLQNLCLADGFENTCSNIAKFCDVKTAAKWCYKDETRKTKALSDKECSRVVKKSQYLTFGRTSEECWKQLPLCEGGNFEACMQVPTLCGKEVVSALCNAKKITNKRMCTYAGLEETTSSSYPGCKFFADKCNNFEAKYCQLASRYCDNDTINDLCRAMRITNESICKRVQAGNSDSFAIPIPIIGILHMPDVLGF